LLALGSSRPQKSIKGDLAVTDDLNQVCMLETIFNPVAVVESAIEKGTASILMPISSRRCFARAGWLPSSSTRNRRATLMTPGATSWNCRMPITAS